MSLVAISYQHGAKLKCPGCQGTVGYAPPRGAVAVQPLTRPEDAQREGAVHQCNKVRGFPPKKCGAWFQVQPTSVVSSAA